MAAVETAVFVVVGASLALVNVIVLYLTVASLRNDRHSPAVVERRRMETDDDRVPPGGPEAEGAAVR